MSRSVGAPEAHSEPYPICLRWRSGELLHSLRRDKACGSFGQKGPRQSGPAYEKYARHTAARRVCDCLLRERLFWASGMMVALSGVHRVRGTVTVTLNVFFGLSIAEVHEQDT